MTIWYDRRVLPGALIALILVFWAGITAPPAAAQAAARDTGSEQLPVVVELFTSQGCSACPPADAFLRELGRRSDVLPLALHIDYWDYIGWKDQFGSAEYTARQRAYADRAKRNVVYTPQMIVDGRERTVGTRRDEVEGLITRHRDAGNETGITLSLDRMGGGVYVRATAKTALSEPLDVVLLRYRPEATVDIARGENAGRQLSYSHIVTEMRRLGAWDMRAPLKIETEVTGDRPVVVLLQRPGPGAIEAAARLR